MFFRKYVFTLVLFVGLASSVSVWAGNEGSGGGNAVVARKFVYPAFVMAQEFKGLPLARLPTWFSAAVFEQAVQNVRAYGVEELEAPEGAKGAYLHARFLVRDKMIHVKWRALDSLSDTEIKALVMHEYLGVLGLEKDGRYDRSSQLLALLEGVTSGNPIDWLNPPVICREEEDFKANYKYPTKGWRDNIQADPAANEDERLRMEIFHDDVTALRVRLRSGLSANHVIPDCIREPGCGRTGDLLSIAARDLASTELIELLLEAGANPNPTLELSGSPLLVTLGKEYSRYAVVRALVAHGARYRDVTGAVDVRVIQALLPGDDQLAADSLCATRSKVMLFQGLGLDLNDPRYPSAMQLAFYMNGPMLRLFKQLGTRFDVVASPAMVAASQARYQGATPLHLLAGNYFLKMQRNHAQVARYLVQNGSNPTAVDAQGLTALDWAWADFSERDCGSDKLAFNERCMAERALIEYLTAVTKR